MDTRDIQKLGLLARIAMDDTEANELNLNAVLDYIKAIENAPTRIGDSSDTQHTLHEGMYNVVREDVVIPTSQETRDLIKQNFPQRKEDYLEVNKILQND